MLSCLFSKVGVTRLELATSRPPDAYSNQLSYTPSFSKALQSYDLFFDYANFLATFFQKKFINFKWYLIIRVL